MKSNRILGISTLFLLGMLADGISAQTPNAVERRLERNARQMQRVDRRVDYLNDQTWMTLDPWIKQYNPGVVGRVGQAVERAADATAAARAAAQPGFGYTNNTPNTSNWAYDYYTFYPRTYSFTGPDNSQFAYRYYDRDRDGIYDGFDSPSRSEANKTNDAFDRYDFSNSRDDSQWKPEQDIQISGTIINSKTTTVNGQPTLIAQIKANNGTTVVVDLGPKDQLEKTPLNTTTKITVEGYVSKIGDKDILFAEAAQIDGKLVDIQRLPPVIEGTVIDLKQVDILGKPHTMAIVDSKETKYLVDVGPASNLKSELSKNSVVKVYGVPVMTHGRQIIMAQKLIVDQHSFNILR